MKIAICSPVPDGGQELFKLLVDSAARLASGRHQIEVEFTCHSETQRGAILDNAPALHVGGSQIVAREAGYFHAASVTHSRCLNALFSSVQADLAVICDFDMAFAWKNWDEVLLDHVIYGGVGFFGTPYSTDAALPFKLGDRTVPARKYQHKPNCMFIAFSPATLRSMTDRLCDFAAIYDAHTIPLKRIESPIESRRYGLPENSFMHVDTGSLIPNLIEEHGLTYHSLIRRVANYKVLRSAKLPADYPSFHLPEEYFYKGEPFVVHLRKGSSMPAHIAYTWQAFMADVGAWIDAVTAPSFAKGYLQNR